MLKYNLETERTDLSINWIYNYIHFSTAIKSYNLELYRNS